MGGISATGERPGRSTADSRHRISQEALQERDRLWVLSHSQFTDRTHPERRHSPSEDALDSGRSGALWLTQEAAEAPWNNKRHSFCLSSAPCWRASELGSQKESATTFHTDFRELVSIGLTADR